MIQLVQEKGYTRVACFCDACDKEITAADGSLYSWNPLEKKSTPVGTRYTPQFFHKGECDRSHKQPYWFDMDVFVVYLATNLEIKWKEARRRAAEFASWA